MRRENLVIYQGADFGPYGWPIYGVDGQPADLTSATVRGQIRATIHDTEVLYEWSTTANNASVVYVAINGQQVGCVVLTIPHSESESWEWTNGVFDVELTANGRRDRICEGKVVVMPEVTR